MKRVLDALFPYSCMGCKTLVPANESFCEECKKTLTIVGELPAIANLTKSAAVYPYRTVAAGVQRGKSSDANVNLSQMAEDMVSAFYRHKLPMPDLILPVPAHWLKTWYKQYDHAAALAKAVGKRMEIPVSTKALAKQQITIAQHTLRLQQRGENVKNAFAVLRPDDIRGKRVLLIDDVITSGNTVSHCAGVLLSSGAKEVCALSYAYTEK